MKECIFAFLILSVFSPLCYSNSEVDDVFDGRYFGLISNDGRYQLKFDARIMLDFGALNSEENPNLTADNDFRRLRFAVKTIIDQDWAAELDLDFEGNEVETRDMWLSYIGLANWNFKLGAHKPNFSLAAVTTSQWHTFIEVPLVSELFAPGRRIGFSANHWKNPYFIGGTIFGDESDVNGSDFEDDNDGVSERFGYALRMAVRPLNFDSADNKNVIHLGFNYLLDKPQSEDESEFRYRSRLESRVADYRFLNTDKMANVNEVKVSGLEFIYVKDNWFIESEIMQSKINFNDGSPSFESSGYYVQASYFLSGTGRGYGFNDAELGSVKPAKGMSAWELSLRFSAADLDDAQAGVLGGKAQIIGLGVNWYANTNILFRFNYLIADLNENADGGGDFVGNDNIDMLLLRAQVMF